MPPRVGELLRRTLGCLGTSVLGLVGAVVLLVAIGFVQEAIRPGFDAPVPAVAMAALLVAGGLATLLVLSRRR